MKTELRYVTFETDKGWLGILGSARGLLCTTLPQNSADDARQQLGADSAVWSPGSFQSLITRLRAYFQGNQVGFPDSLDLTLATTFQRCVWETTQTIPYGETRSYSWLARTMQRPQAARAVGQALSRNPLPVIIPCHRVLTSSHRLGGYRGGWQMKKYLLSLEGISFRE